MIFEYALIYVWPLNWPAADLTQLFQPSSRLILITMGWMNLVAINTDYKGVCYDSPAGHSLAILHRSIFLKNQLKKSV
jgi:hypothetical protein